MNNIRQQKPPYYSREEYSNLEQQLTAALEREKLVMDCVKLYANEKNWGRYVMWLLNYNGFTPAQECVKKVEAMK